MKKLFSTAMLGLGLIAFASCNSPKTEKAEVAEVKSEMLSGACCDNTEKSCCSSNATSGSEKIQIVYFHNERRCATCMAVEEVTNEVVAALDSSKVSFVSYTIGDETCKELEKKFEVSGQTLLVIGSEGTQNLTNTAFMNARVNPDQFKKDLSEALKL